MKNYRIGTWSIIPSPMVADIMCAAGLDFVITDYEHGSSDYVVTQETAMAVHSRGKKLYVRVSALEEKEILKALETGIDGIIVPNVKTVKECQDIVRYCRYYPDGIRGFNPFTRAFDYSGDRIKCKNDKAEIGVIIESLEGLNNLEYILRIEEISIVYIGAYDISNELGYPGKLDNELVAQTLQNALFKVINSTKKAGAMFHNNAEKYSLIQSGVEFLVYGVDSNLLYQKYREVLN